MVTGTGFDESSIVNWGGSPLPTTFVDLTTLTAILSQEMNDTAGEIMVTVINPAPGGGTSNQVPFSVFGYSPFNNEKLTSSKVSFVWDAIPDAVIYKIQLSTLPDFSVPLLNIKTIEPTYFFDTYLQYNKTYYWRIRPFYAESKGDWLPIWQFNSMDPLSKPVLTSPLHKSILQTSDVTLQWETVENATGYKILIAKDSLFTIKYAKLKTTDLSALFSSLPDGKYYWRVRALDQYGAKSPWSDYRIFKVSVP
jgi:hypothetical protein